MIAVCSAALLVALMQDVAPVRTVDRGRQSDVSAARQVTVREPDEWTTLWRSHASGRPQPAVDFSRETIVGVFMGTRQTAGFAIDIVGYRDVGTDVVVEYRETIPPPGAITAQVLTSPYHLAAIPRRAGNVTFEKITR